MSNQRLITFIFLAAAAIAGFCVRAAYGELFGALGWPDPILAGFVSASMLGAVVVGVVTYVALLRNTKAVTFVDEVLVEMRKITWPGRDETISSTTVVLATSFTLAFSLALFDFIWAKVTQIFLYS